MVVTMELVFWLAADIHTEALVELFIGLRDDDREERIAATQVLNTIEHFLRSFVGGGTDRERDDGLVGVKARIVGFEHVGLELTDRLDRFV